MIFLYILLLLAGFVLLVKGADLFVDGSAALAGNLHVPGVVIGLTIVALGTSAPELAVSTSAAITGANEIALSNVTGSNIFNLLGVLGMCAVICAVPVDDVIIKRDFPISICSVLLVLVVTAAGLFTGSVKPQGINDTAGTVGRPLGIICLILFAAYIIMLIKNARNTPDTTSEHPLYPVSKCILLIIAGLVMIIAGGQLVVKSARWIASFFGMSETLIGLTIVAIGTSLPELVTSVVAARKKETGLAVGNVVGSNIFNMLFILGISATIHPISVNLASIYDLFILLAVSVIAYAFSIGRKSLSRPMGIIMLLLYVSDVVYAILR